MTTRHYLKTLLLCLLSLPILAQADLHVLPTIPLKTLWKKGEAYSYELTKGTKQYWDNKEDNHQQNKQLVTLKVLDNNMQGSVVEATYNSAAYFLPESLKRIKGYEQLIEKYKEIKVRYAIAPSGAFLGILNGQALQELMMDMFDVAETLFEKTSKHKLPWLICVAT